MTRAATFLAMVLLAGLTAGAAQPTRAASTTVSVAVPTATALDTTGCSAGQPDRTDFGTVLPGSARVTSLDCVVRFGSSNGTGTLQLSQLDRRGPAMYAPTDGDRDVGFSGDSVFSTPVGAGTGADLLNESVLTSDDKIVVVGTCHMGATALDVCLIRTNRAGTPDPTFDGDGIRTLALGPGANLDYGIAIAEVAGGKLLMASQCYSGTTGLDHCLVRLLADGSLDPTFGSGGMVLRDFTANHEFVRGLAVLPSGSFLVAGDCEVGGPPGRRQCVARYLPDGTLDTTFGSGGLATNLPGGPGPAHDTQLLVTADGSIILGGACYVDAVTDFDLCLSRFRANGALDTSFGSAGSVLTVASNNYDMVGHLVELGNGRILAGGHCDMGTAATGWDACFARYAANGTPDAGFGTAGVSRLPISAGNGNDLLRAVFEDGTGKLVSVGACSDVATGVDFCVYRLQGNGTLDTTFGTGGVVVHAIAAGAGADNTRHARALGDGQILVTGGCDMPTTGQDACAIVLDSAGSISQYQSGTADWSTLDTGHFAACLLASGTSAANWPTSSACPASNGTFWRAIPEAPAGVATAPSGTTNATANFRFGLRLAPSQPAGSYLAPLRFTVVGA